MRSLRNIMGIKWQDKITNQEVLDRANLTSIESLLLKAQLRWAGHVIRMEDHRIPRQLMYGELQKGSRKRGRPKLRFKDTLKRNLSWCKIQPRELESSAAVRSSWRTTISKAAIQFENSRRQVQAEKREKRHIIKPIQDPTYSCDICGRRCASSFGLRSHKRSH